MNQILVAYVGGAKARRATRARTGALTQMLGLSLDPVKDDSISELRNRLHSLDYCRKGSIVKTDAVVWSRVECGLDGPCFEVCTYLSRLTFICLLTLFRILLPLTAAFLLLLVGANYISIWAGPYHMLIANGG